MATALTAQFNQTTQNTGLQAYLLEVVCTGVNMPSEVFVFQRGAAPAPAAGETVRDFFVCIADPVDLEEIPATAPNLSQEIPYYRLNRVQLAFRTIDDLNECKGQIQQDLSDLTKTVNELPVLSAQETQTYGSAG